MAKERKTPLVLTVTHTAPTVDNADGEVLAANANRDYAILINDSDTVMYLNLGGTAAANTGIRIAASGGSYELGTHALNYRGAINAIHGGGAVNKVLLVSEGT